MGQKFKDEAGNIWEMDAGGQPRLVSGGQSPAMGPSIGNDPRLPYQVQQDQGQAAAARYAAPKAQADTTIAQANAANAQAVAEAQARKAEAEARIAEMNARNGKSQLSPETRAAAIAGYRTAQSLRDIADGLGPKFIAGPGATNGAEGLLDYLPLTANQQFDTAGNKARGIVGQALGFTGGQLNTEREAERSVGPYIPQSSDRDAKALDKIQSLQKLADDAEARAIAILGGVPDANGNITPVGQPAQQIDKSAPLVNNAPPQDKVGFSHGTRDVIDPVLKGVSGRLGKMVAAGASDATVMEFLKKNGVDPSNTNIGAVLQHRKTKEFKDWQRANPGAPYPIGSDFYTNKVPLTLGQNLGNEAAQSAVGAGVINYAQGVTGNRLDNLANALGGDGEAVNTGVQLSRANSPNASFAGDLAGQATAQYLMGRIPGLRALPNSSLGRMGEDAIYGAYAGSGDEDVGAGSGMLANVVGGKLGRGIGRGAGLAAKGIEGGPSLAYLNNAGVPLTLGQIGRGTNSTTGNAIAGLEERAAGFPLFDSIVNSARQRGDVGFNREMFRQIGEPVGVAGAGRTGVAGLADARATRNGAYSFLDSTRLNRDATYDADNLALNAQISGLPDFGGQVQRKVDLVNGSFDPSGGMSGRDWQSSVRALRGDRGKIASQPFGQDAADILGGVENNLSGLVARQVPDGAQNLANANRVNANFKTAQAALKGRVAQRNGVLTDATTLNDASIRGATKFGGIDNALQGQRPFYDLTTAGMDVMPNLTPDSGTAGRAIFYSALPGVLGGGIGAGAGAVSDDMSVGDGAATGAGVSMIPTLALAALYSKGGQKGIQKMLLGKRPKILQDAIMKVENNFIGKRLNKRAAGMFGSAAARDLFLYPELYPPQN